MKKKIETNDYINTTRNYMKYYRLHQQYLENVKESLNEISRKMTGGEIRAVAYDKGAKGSCCDVDGVARMAFKRMELERDKEQILGDAKLIATHLHTIDSSLQKLTSEERGILQDYYIDKLSYNQLVDKYHFSERWCRKILRRAEKKLAVMLFGIIANEPILFLKNGAKKGPSN